MRIRHLLTLALLLGTLIRAACAATPEPEEYGFRRVAIKGQEYYCAPREWVLGSMGDAPRHHTQIACLAPHVWPLWLEVRNLPRSHFPITPREAERLADSYSQILTQAVDWANSQP
jgi:hypothetical protein